MSLDNICELEYDFVLLLLEGDVDLCELDV